MFKKDPRTWYIAIVPIKSQFEQDLSFYTVVTNCSMGFGHREPPAELRLAQTWGVKCTGQKVESETRKGLADQMFEFQK